MIKLKYRNSRLFHNPDFPVEYSHEVINQWEDNARKEPLASALANVSKRLFIHAHVFIAGGKRFRAKYYRSVGMKRRLEALFFGAEPLLNYRASLRVGKAGLLTATPLCVWGSWKTGLHDSSVLFMKDLGNLKPLPDYLDALAPSDRDKKSQIGLALAQELAKLHETRTYVHDPSKNILVKEVGGEIKFIFIDFDTVKWFFPLTKRRVARTLRHCIHPPKNLELFDRDEIAAYVRAYCEARGLSHWFDNVYPLV